MIRPGTKGTLWLDFVSLFPAKTWKDRPNGLRPDIAQMIADLKPGFVRFPGGCVVEGGTVEIGVQLETHDRPGGRATRMLGAVELSPHARHGSARIPAVLRGHRRRALMGRLLRTDVHIPPPSRRDGADGRNGLGADNFLDLVEYANGERDTAWGEKRAAAGHAEPFGLEYVEIGNENQGPELRDRYLFIYDAHEGEIPGFEVSGRFVVDE